MQTVEVDRLRKKFYQFVCNNCLSDLRLSSALAELNVLCPLKVRSINVNHIFIFIVI